MYNPPVIYQPPAEETQGTFERRAFSESYGMYTELTYSLSKGDPTKVDEVESWETSKYLYWGEYLIRKRMVENIK